MRTFCGDSEKIYTWWDYRTHGFSKNNGLRLDYIFTCKDIQVKYTEVLKEVRALPRPSDHAPVVVEI
jgi:exodeoxyribonuclease-3